MTSMLTPIIKATKGKDVKAFYTLSEYNEWKDLPGSDKYSIKYYKGLGTSTSSEAREYFKSIETSKVSYTNCDDLDDVISLAFSKTKADDRKQWLLQYDPEIYIDQSEKQVTVHDFIHKDLIHFSNHDNVRSIPNVMDGLKPSQRKVLYGCLKKNVKKEMKVAQLSGAVAEVSAYHSGEASLQGTIVAMAQTFVGSNNVNLLQPNGQFGTRLQGGKDAASSRYIFTQLNPLTLDIFKADDDALLKYLDDDGQSIEPMYYAPIIPMILVNGATGIGTGFSTSVPSHDPRAVAENVLRVLDGKTSEDMTPWYRNFKGTITATDKGWQTTGVYRRLDDTTVEITELPIGKWTDDYKEFLETAAFDEPADGKKRKQSVPISSYENHSTESHVRFKVKLSKKISDADMLSLLRLTSAVSTTNMHLYNSRGVIQKYETTEDIFQEFSKVRLALYEARREYVIGKLEKELLYLRNKHRFLLEIQEDKLTIYKRNRAEVEADLSAAGYARMESDAATEGSVGDYNYLTQMQISSFTSEKLEELAKNIRNKEVALATMQDSTASQLWKQDIDAMLLSYAESALAEEEEDDPRLQSSVVAQSSKKRRKQVAV